MASTRRNATPKGTSTQQSRYDVQMKGSVDITGLADTNPTAQAVGRANNPTGDIIQALGSVGSAMSSMNQASEQRSATRKAAARGKASDDVPAAGEEWETKIASGDWGSSGPNGPEEDPYPLETHMIQTIRQYDQQNLPLADALQEVATLHAQPYIAGASEEEAEAFLTGFIPQQVKRLGDYYRTEFLQTQWDEVRSGTVTYLADGVFDSESGQELGIGPGNGANRDQFQKAWKAWDSDRNHGNVTRSEAAGYWLDAAMVATQKGDYKHAAWLSSVATAGASRGDRRAILGQVEAAERGMLDERRSHSKAHIRQFAESPDAEMPDNWINDLAANSTSKDPKSDEAYARGITTSLVVGMEGFPGDSHDKKAHLRNLAASDGIVAYSPLHEAIVLAAQQIPDEDDEASETARQNLANQREARSFSASMALDGNLVDKDGKPITYKDDDGNDIEVVDDDGYRKFLQTKYGRHNGDFFYTEYLSDKSTGSSTDSSDHKLYVDYDEQLQNAENPTERDSIVDAIRLSAKNGNLSRSEYDALTTKALDEDRFDEDKWDEEFQDALDTVAQSWWVSLNMSPPDDGDAAFDARDVQLDPKTGKAAGYLGQVIELMEDEYREWYSSEETEKLRQGDNKGYIAERRKVVRGMKARFLGTRANLEFDPVTGELMPGKFPLGIIRHTIDGMKKEYEQQKGTAWDEKVLAGPTSLTTIPYASPTTD